ncbi:MAG TPA: beta-galactosidase [bacterium]|nr:beta-galactosidase [bacterium]
MIVNSIAVNQKKLIERIPEYVQEKKVGIETFNISRWIFSEGVQIKRARFLKENCLEIKYEFKDNQKKIDIDFMLPENHFEGERIGFKLYGNGKKDKIEVWCKYRDSFIPLSMISLGQEKWQIIEMPASSPIHLFYKSVDRIKFTIVNREDNPHSGKFYISQMKFISPVLIQGLTVRKPEKKQFLSFIFDTWGAGGNDEEIEKNVETIKNIGINLHIIPVSFPSDIPEKNIENRKWLEGKIKSFMDKGIKIGISFYNTPPDEFAKKHPELLMKNENGEIYDTGGFFLSPWHPEVEKLWVNYIIDTLNFLKERNLLEKIEVIMLCPGHESEISYEWSHIWAFDENAIASYRDYLKKKYRNNIIFLNEDMGTDYKSFADIKPPKNFYPDREHWVFVDFYRLSMLKWCVKLADAVKEVFTPSYWLWLPHTHPDYPGRFFSGRYPIFYIENLKKLDIVDYVHIPALDWQSIDDVNLIKKMGVKVIGEVDVVPSPARLEWTFNQSLKYGFDGVYIGIIENICRDGKLTEAGEICRKLIDVFKSKKGGEK